MGRMRLHTKRLKKFNQLGGTGGEAIRELNLTGAILGTISAETITTATITTANITTGNINVVIATSVGATNLDGSIITAEDKLIVPTTPYTGANVTNGSFYTTGTYMYVGRGGAWISGILG